jgi:ribose transport system ATP-binding protein
MSVTISDSARVPALDMRAISKRFAGVQALQDVSLASYPGEVVAVIGENGAGKSTLMKVLGGIHRPDSGEIRVDDRIARIGSVGDAIRLGVSFIHQELNTLDNLDVAGNIFLGREPLLGGPLCLLNSGKMWSECRPYLEQLGLGSVAGINPDTPLSELSIAHRQMVEIAKALSLRARIVVMDEPTSSLTLAETDRLLDVVRGLRAQGVSIVYISHRLGEVHEIADRVVALRDGKNAGELSKEEIAHDAMVRLMVGRDIEKFFAPPPATQQKLVLSVSGLRTRRYPKCEVRFDLRAGEIVGMAGLIGAGRSEVAQALFGVERATAGSIALEGAPIRVRSPKDAIRHGIYLAPEDRRRSGVIIDMTIRENITLPALNRYAVAGLPIAAREWRAAALAVTSLHVRTPSVEFPVKNLSGGNQQKVVLARWLALDPKVLILDEPTRGIDVGAKAEIYDLIRGLAARGVAILMISSDMEEILHMSDRIAVMHEGRVTGVLTREEATEEAVMQLAVGHSITQAA